MSKEILLIKRTFAFGIDIFMALSLWMNLTLLVIGFYSSKINLSNFNAFFSYQENFLVLSAFTVFPIVFLAYFTSSYYLMNGRTFGKKSLKIRCYSLEDDFTLSLSFKRASLQLFSYITFGSLNLYALLNPKRKSLIEIITSTSHEKRSKNKLILLDYSKDCDTNIAA